MKKLFSYFSLLLVLFSPVSNVFALTTTSNEAGEPKVTIKAPQQISDGDWVNLDVGVTNSSPQTNSKGKVEVTVPKTIVSNSTELLNSMEIGAPFSTANTSVREDSQGNYVFDVDYDSSTVSDGNTTSNFKVKFKAHFSEDTSLKTVDFKASFVQEGTVNNTSSAASTILTSNGLKSESSSEKSESSSEKSESSSEKSESSSEKSESSSEKSKSSDSPKVSLQTPKEIGSNDLVKLSVLLGASNGELPKDGLIAVKIPKVIVRNKNDLINLAGIGLPFTWAEPAITEEGENYVLNIRYSAEEINQDEATAYTINLAFQAPLFYQGAQYSNIPDNLGFSVKVTDGDTINLEDSKTVPVIKKAEPALKTFDKLGKIPTDTVNGVKTYKLKPTFSENIFNLTVNYKGEPHKNVVVSDQLPDDAYLVDAKKYLPATGDMTSIGHIRILAVSSRDESGNPNGWKYVTSEFKDKITFTKNSFSIDFGDLAQGEGYVVEYAVGTDNSDAFGVQYNEGKMSYDGYKEDVVKAPMTVYNPEYSRMGLLKSVDKPLVAPTDTELKYSLKLTSYSTEIPAGTVVTDKLTSSLKFKELVDFDQTKLEDFSYDEGNNTITYRTKVPVKPGESLPMSFKASIVSQLKKGDTISNVSSFNFNGSTLASNRVTSVVNGQANLVKIDDETLAPLSGAVFTLQDEQGNPLHEGLTSDTDGVVSVNNLKPGKYQLVETQAPDGYELDTTPVKFTIVANQSNPIRLVKTNTIKRGSVVLTKVDDDSRTPLRKAVFTLQDEQGNPVREGLESGADGKLTINDLRPGKYKLVETQAPDGYELDATPVEFEIEKNQQTAVEVEKTNTLKPGSVVLTKVDADSKAPLENAVFTLQDEQGNPLQADLTTGADGKLTINDLKPGKYKLVETQAPDGYELDATPVEFEIEKNQQTAVEVEKTNTLKPGSVVLTKVDADSKAPLENAVFTLQDEQGKPLQEGLTTGTDGKLTINDLKPGKYKLVETQAPDGYELDATPVEFEIEKNQQTAVEVEKTNTLKPGSVVLTKVDADSKAPLENAVFTLQDEQGNPLQADLTTGADGKLTINDLKPGKYKLVETQAPDGYELDATPVEFEIEKNQQTAVEVEKTNTLKPGSVVLTKVDADSKAPLENAVFTLQDEQGNPLQADLTTGADGKLTINDLKPGKYKLVETQAPDGYELDATPVEFEIEKNQQTAVEVEKTNTLKPGSVVLTKVDADSKAPLENAVFTLQDEQGKPLQEGLTTGTDGKLTINDLKPGKYKLVETQAPDGYELDATPVEFEIEKNQQTAVEVEKTNTLKPGSVVLTKVDADSKAPLENAVFTLQDEQGNPLQADLTTGADGKLTINDLKPGKYKLVETQAPDGYELDATPVEFEIEKNQQTAVEVEKTNTLKPGSVVLTKVDADSKAPLENAVFTLQDEQGNPLQADLTTGADGKLTINDLKPGKYKLVETQAPDGYELDATPVEFEIEKNQQTAVEVEKTNTLKQSGSTDTPKPDGSTNTSKPGNSGHSEGDKHKKEKGSKKLPATGEKDTKIFSIIGLGILAILAILGTYISRKKTK